MTQRKIAILGLGYVGLPVAVAFAGRFPGTLGFDIDVAKVKRIAAGDDPAGQLDGEELRNSELVVSHDSSDLADRDFFIVAVPTPIDRHRRPDLSALEGASRTVGAVLKKGDIVVFESTVYPGVTEEVCSPILEERSGLKAGVDFHLGYSPERINPGDKEHSFERIQKVVSAQDEATLDIVADCYGSVVTAGVYRATSIKVAEAAKVIENIQRDLNIALVNELSQIFDKIGIETSDVLEAAGTKWNFHRYRPGLVGGHCIGVDPYYLTTKAEELGLHPQVILAGRRINDGMGSFVAQKAIRLLVEAGKAPRGARIAVLGLAFKPDVSDLRNSKVPDVVEELVGYGAQALVFDPLVDRAEAAREYGLEIVKREDLVDLDAVILAVPHRDLKPLAIELAKATSNPLVIDVQWGLAPTDLPDETTYWRL
ncbi:MAG: UDP-N-acetyl-D-galactosamine dehydrogenase [Planctomycetota bacterium]|jgi:UDP-N-acetyl-D-galactosamine dehydrogenase